MFIQAGGLYPGGFSGISVLSTRLIFKYTGINVPFALFYISLNIIPTFLVFKYVGKRFTIFSVIQYSLVSLFTLLIPNINVTGDIILISVFGGILAGFATSLSLSVNASGGGTDFLAIYAANKFKREPWSAVHGRQRRHFGHRRTSSSDGTKPCIRSFISFVYSQVVSARHLRYKHVTLIIITQKPDEMMSSDFLRRFAMGSLNSGAKADTATRPEACCIWLSMNSRWMKWWKRVRLWIPNVFISINKTERVIGNYYQKPLE